MKKAGAILCLTLLIILTSFSFSFAQGLELEKSYPVDGSSDSRPENFVVKLTFNEDVSKTELQEDRADAFRFTDIEGKELPIQVLYDEKRKKEIWILVDEILQSDSSYTLYISGEFTNANGNALGEDKTINLKTRNINTDNNVNMALMGVMMVGMIVFTSISAKRQLKKKESEAMGENKVKVNPYKVSKETGKSVEHIVAKTEKEKAKARAQAEKNKGKALTDGQEPARDETSSSGARRVARPRPISASGSAYITGRKAEAAKERQRAAARAAAGTTRPKGATGKSKDKKAKNKKR
jgi:hypothetical protein